MIVEHAVGSSTFHHDYSAIIHYMNLHLKLLKVEKDLELH